MVVNGALNGRTSQGGVTRGGEWTALTAGAAAAEVEQECAALKERVRGAEVRAAVRAYEIFDNRLTQPTARKSSGFLKSRRRSEFIKIGFFTSDIHPFQFFQTRAAATSRRYSARRRRRRIERRRRRRRYRASSKSRGERLTPRAARLGDEYIYTSKMFVFLFLVTRGLKKRDPGSSTRALVKTCFFE